MTDVAHRTASTAPPRRSGTVVWVDLSTTDIDGSIEFYARLFDWRFERTETPMGAYLVARVDHGEVGGMMAQPAEDRAAGVPSTWTVVVGDDHLDETLERARELGGSVLQPPVPIPGGARLAVVADPTGAALALMEAPPSPQGIAWGETGAVSWVECQSRDPGAARRFYEQLLGWEASEGPGGYVVFDLEGERVGGLMGMPPSVPADVPSSWVVYFAVVDAEATCTRAEAHGGTVLAPVHPIEEGRFAVLADPAGAVFAIFETGDRSR